MKSLVFSIIIVIILIYHKSTLSNSQDFDKLTTKIWRISASSIYFQEKFPADIFSIYLTPNLYHAKITRMVSSFYLDVTCSKELFGSTSPIFRYKIFVKNIGSTTNKTKSLILFFEKTLCGEAIRIHSKSPENDVEIVVDDNYWFLLRWKMMKYVEYVLFMDHTIKNVTNDYVLQVHEKIYKDS